MWSLLLTTFNTLSSSALLQEFPRELFTQRTTKASANHFNFYGQSFEIAQTLNRFEAISPSGYSLKFSPTWQKFITENANPNSDIFLRRSFPNRTGEIIVTITTTVRDFLGIPKNLPSEVKKIDAAADTYAVILSQSGYKVADKKLLLINGKRAIKLVTETPQKQGSTTILLEMDDERMVVSTSIYPIDSSIISPEVVEQIGAEIDLVQNSITIRD
jgi:hypothetical protein